VKRSVRDELTWDVTHWYLEAMLRISLYRYLYLNWQKRFVALIIAFVFCPTKLEIRAEQILPGNDGEVDGGTQVVGSNDPNNICTCE
jgi:hypothetical protein